MMFLPIISMSVPNDRYLVQQAVNKYNSAPAHLQLPYPKFPFGHFRHVCPRLVHQLRYMLGVYKVLVDSIDTVGHPENLF